MSWLFWILSLGVPGLCLIAAVLIFGPSVVFAFLRTTIGKIVAGVALGVIALFSMRTKWRREGRQIERQKHAEAEAQLTKEAKDGKDDIDRMPIDDVRDRLREHAKRKP